MREEKGITLIALVITIIVMLILVAVSITIAVNGGLFSKAQNASVQTNQAIADEQHLGSGYATVQDESNLQNETIDNIVSHYTTTPTN